MINGIKFCDKFKFNKNDDIIIAYFNSNSMQVIK